MEYVRFGSTGMKVSKLCLGCMTYGSNDWREWVLNEEHSRPFIRKALDMGINFFDTADMYSYGASEEILGRAITQYASRDDVVISTKVFHPMSERPNDQGLSRKHILKSIDASLKRLGTDYVDLYIIHRFDPETPIEETIEALDTVVRSGKARYIGASSMHSWQFMRMLSLQEQNGLAKFVSMQNHYNLVYREEEREMLPLCREMGIAVTPWSPLARGLLAGTRKDKTLRAATDQPAQLWYDDYQQEELIVEAVMQIAVKRGVPPAQVALSWLTHRPGVTSPIIGATKPHHLDDAVAGLSLKLTSEELCALEKPYRARPVAGHD
ncbi:aldo/keto reductase [bacteria symbiont BFo2 of Frankliniella occidentalis]|nr:aldo/keto reductase [bacteria symbiont BFo2 of Frankliniella occidentalis]KYP88071.1 aldo/keto reductase [bacteria symbiont BFo2 of Frankliniella occidentalis]KYP92884.1 aldo/keto reductase [bacteria symbiont BFo2 of Frankliniella occidentalis]